jgi:hypothetical protein
MQSWVAGLSVPAVAVATAGVGGLVVLLVVLRLVRRDPRPLAERDELSSWRRARAWLGLPTIFVGGPVGAVLSFNSVVQAVPPELSRYRYLFPIPLDIMIFGFAVMYVTGVRLGRPSSGYRTAMHSLVALTIYMNILASPSWRTAPWHIIGSLVWSFVVEMVARDVLGDMRAHRAVRTDLDSLTLGLWLTALPETFRAAMRRLRDPALSVMDARMATEACAAARDLLRARFPGREHWGLRRKISRRLWSGVLPPARLMELMSQATDADPLLDEVLMSVGSITLSPARNGAQSFSAPMTPHDPGEDAAGIDKPGTDHAVPRGGVAEATLVHGTSPSPAARLQGPVLSVPTAGPTARTPQDDSMAGFGPATVRAGGPGEESLIVDPGRGWTPVAAAPIGSTSSPATGRGRFEPAVGFGAVVQTVSSPGSELDRPAPAPGPAMAESPSSVATVTDPRPVGAPLDASIVAALPTVGERIGTQAGTSAAIPTTLGEGQVSPGVTAADQQEESVTAVSAWSDDSDAEPDPGLDAVASSSSVDATSLGIQGDVRPAGPREQTTAAAEAPRARLTAPSGGSSTGHDQAPAGAEDDAIERWASIAARLARSEAVDAKDVAAEFGIAERTGRTSVQRGRQLLALAGRIAGGQDISAAAVAAELKIATTTARKLLERARRPLVAADRVERGAAT